MEPLISRIWQESHQDWPMRTATLMQETLERRTSITTCFSEVKFALWTLHIHIRSGSSQSGYDPNSIRIDFGCSVDTASEVIFSKDAVSGCWK